MSAFRRTSPLVRLKPDTTYKQDRLASADRSACPNVACSGQQLLEAIDWKVRHAEELRPPRALAVVVGSARDTNAMLGSERQIACLSARSWAL